VHRSDTGPFALVPVWVLDLPISHLAVRVYAVHADWADRGGSHHHCRQAIADRLGVTVRSIDDAHKALVAHKALRIEHRRDAAGDPTSNRYWIRRVPPGVAKQISLPSEAGEATGSEADFSLTRPSYVNHKDIALPPPLTEEQKAHALAQVRRLRRREEEPA
jgi:hypothetical protein